ncbi:hypothetical protein EPI10_000203 [Gossypium australe]|uniref:Uncharacterized protein n=1 Tax=Gossypium australe TaxID=47621 RepID=A0A5B6V6Y7_9ROSI|nr:hypothetical protein EPI10_000203 [Gossypium australe]
MSTTSILRFVEGRSVSSGEVLEGEGFVSRALPRALRAAAHSMLALGRAQEITPSFRGHTFGCWGSIGCLADDTSKTSLEGAK